MEKKSILFAANYMNLGGVEKSLLALVNTLSASEFDVHFALMNSGGKLFDHIPPHVTVHYIEPYRNALTFLNNPVKETWRRLRSGNRTKALKDFGAYASAKVRGTLHPLYAYLLRGDKSLTDMEFDLAVNYAGPSEMLDYYIVNHIKAKRKALWIHFDLNHTFDRKKSSQMTHGGYDRVFCVSPDALRVYKERYPSFADKAEFFPNIVNEEEVIRLADEPGVFSPIKGVINLVTVGRLEHLKGQDIALRALALLPPHYHWHFIGGGSDEETVNLDFLSRKLDVDKRTHFHGMQANPYPFMKGADIYVQPSRSEGASITLAEIKVLERPVVTTPFVCAGQMLKEYKDRYVIAATMEPSALARAIIDATEMVGKPREAISAPERHNPLEVIRKLMSKIS